MDRAILHCDMNNFFASVECVLDSSLKGKPMAVCGNVEERHGIVLARNYLARDFGIKTAEPVYSALKKCPNLTIVNEPHYDEYEKYSKLAHEIYLRYTDQVEAMGIDECWLDITHSLKLFGEPKKIADEIRETIKKELGLTISVGVSFNKTFAKLGSDYKKPDATTVISRENYKEIVWPLPVDAIIGVGRRTKEELNRHFIKTVGDIAHERPETLEYLFGKNGIDLYNAANGMDDEPVANYDEEDMVKSVSHGITTVTDLHTDDEVWKVMLELAQEIAFKLRDKDLRAGGVFVAIRNDMLMWEQYRIKLPFSEQSAINIAEKAFELFKKKYNWERPIRTVTIGAINLIEKGTPEAIRIFDDIEKKEKIEKAEKCMEDINFKYGEGIVMNARLMDDTNLPNARRKIKYDKDRES